MKTTKVIVFFLITLSLVWNVLLYFLPSNELLWHYLFNAVYGLIPLYAAFIAFRKNLPWTGIGLSSNAIALFIWSYYNLILQQSIPYPGIPDIFFLIFYPTVGFGFIKIIKKIGGSFNTELVIQSIIIWIILFTIIYTFLNQGSLGESLPLLTRILNVTYPLLDAGLVAIAFAALRTQTGYLNPQILVFDFGFLFMVAADTTFSFRSANELYWNGDITDTFYVIAYSLMTIGTVFIDVSPTKDENPTSPVLS